VYIENGKVTREKIAVISPFVKDVSCRVMQATCSITDAPGKKGRYVTELNVLPGGI
jgi:hypothetical protein